MEKHRPAAQRSRNVAMLVNDSCRSSPNSSGRFEIAKSVPDFLDSKYLEFRRPWYGNPDYKGPRNFIPSTSRLTSPSESLYNMETVQTLHRNQKMFRNSAQQINYDVNSYKNPRPRIHAKISITESEPLDSRAFYSFENLMRDKPRHGANSTKLSSSPDSAFSVQNSQLDSNFSSFRFDSATRKKQRSAASSISPRQIDTEVAEEEIRPLLAGQQEQCPRRSNDCQLVQDPCQINECSNYPQLIGTAIDQGSIQDNNLIAQDNQISSDYHLDNRMLKNWRKGTTFQSDESELTSVTDDEINNLPVPTRRSYHRPVPTSKEAKCEALFYVFSYLDMRSLARCGGVNRLWRSVSKEPVLWRKFRMKDCDIRSSTFLIMSRWCTKVKEISLENIKSSENHTTAKESKGINLNIFESSLVKLIEINKETIKTIKITNCDEIITNQILWSISTLCCHITKIVYISKKHSLGQEDLYPLGRGCPGITSLIISPGWPCDVPLRFDDACCETIAKCWTKILVLCVGGRLMTFQGLRHIANGCIKLQHLEIDHGPEITEDCASRMVSIGLRGLEKVDFTHTPISPRAVVIFTNACPKLNHIGIHCNMTDYFPDHKSSKSKSNFNSLKTLFRRLKSRPGYNNILDINFDYDVDR